MSNRTFRAISQPAPPASGYAADNPATEMEAHRAALARNSCRCGRPAVVTRGEQGRIAAFCRACADAAGRMAAMRARLEAAGSR